MGETYRPRAPHHRGHRRRARTDPGLRPGSGSRLEAQDTRRWAPEKLKKTDSVTGKNAAKSAAAAAASKERGDGTGTFKPRDVVWPAAGQAKVDLNAEPPAPPLGARFLTGARSAAPAAPVAEPSRAGSAPVWVEAADRARSGNAGPRTGKAAVTLADKKAAEKAGVQGLLLAVKSAEGTEKGAPVKVSVDVSHIAGAFGGDWLSRARLVELPECALITPDRPECQKQTPVATVKDDDRPGLLSAEVSSRPTARPRTPPASTPPRAERPYWPPPPRRAAAPAPTAPPASPPPAPGARAAAPAASRGRTRSTSRTAWAAPSPASASRTARSRSTAVPRRRTTRRRGSARAGTTPPASSSAPSSPAPRTARRTPASSASRATTPPSR